MRALMIILTALALGACAGEKEKGCEHALPDLCQPSPPTENIVTCEILPSTPKIQYPDLVVRTSRVTYCSNRCVTYAFVDDLNTQFVECN